MNAGVRTGLIAALAVVVIVSVLVVAWYELQARKAREWELLKVELLAATSVAAPIIDALDAYRHDNGKFPAGLPGLVPAHIASLPATGFTFDTEWQYRVSREADDYDLWVWVPSDYCPPTRSFMHFDDCFVYRHSGVYERLEYGGVLERIGRWAYYHE